MMVLWPRTPVEPNDSYQAITWTFPGGNGQGRARLSQAVFALNLFLRQATNPRQRASAVGHSDCHEDLVGARCIIHANLHPIKVATHKSGVLVAKRNIERNSRSTPLFRGRDQRRAL